MSSCEVCEGVRSGGVGGDMVSMSREWGGGFDRVIPAVSHWIEDARLHIAQKVKVIASCS